MEGTCMASAADRVLMCKVECHRHSHKSLVFHIRMLNVECSTQNIENLRFKSWRSSLIKIANTITNANVNTSYTYTNIKYR